MTAIGLPSDRITLILAVDWFLDRFRCWKYGSMILLFHWENPELTLLSLVTQVAVYIIVWLLRRGNIPLTQFLEFNIICSFKTHDISDKAYYASVQCLFSLFCDFKYNFSLLDNFFIIEFLHNWYQGFCVRRLFFPWYRPNKNVHCYRSHQTEKRELLILLWFSLQ